MRRARKSGFVAQSSLAGVLAVLLFVLGLLAASGPLHRLFHRDGHANDRVCAICLFAHAQVNAAAGTAVLAVVTFSLLYAVTRTDSPVLPQTEHLLPLGRAPPQLSFAS